MPIEDNLNIANKSFKSRLMLGTGKYKSFDECAKAVKASGAEIVTVAVRRVNIIDKKKPLLMDYLNPKKIYCNEPNLGKGFVKSEHGKLSIPSPAVIDLLSKSNIKVSSSFGSIDGELSTPTGIALITNLANSYIPPSRYSIESYGVGIGNLQFPFPNLVRVLKIKSYSRNIPAQKVSPRSEEIVVQEAWIDDQSPEDISNFVEKLRQ